MTQPLWIRYTTIPEAFPALSLVYAGLVWLLSFERLTLRHAWVFSIVLLLGIGTHHMFVLTVPIFAVVDLANATVVVGMGIGYCRWVCIVRAVIFEGQSGWSWGEVSTLSDVTRYFLRADYGTFQITHHAQEGTWWGTPWMYIKTTFVESWGVLHIGIVTVAVEEEGGSTFVVLGLILSWCVVLVWHAD